MLRKLLLGCASAFCLASVGQVYAQEVYNYESGRVEKTGYWQNSNYLDSKQPYQQNGQQSWGYAPKRHFYSGNWALTLGGTVYSAPKYIGSDSYEMKFSPIISLGKTGGNIPRFTSRNDNISFSLYDNGPIRLGLAGKVLWSRDGDESGDLVGLDPVKWGAEVGGFAEIYPFDGLRIRTELRRGVRSHDAFVVDLAVDAYHDLTPTVRISGGPRAFYAGDDYFKTYYGVNTLEAQRSGLAHYSPNSGWGSVGVGGAVTWKTTDKIDTSIFAEYNHLQGPAANSSLVRERGSKNQLTFGVSASYRFDFHVD